MRFSSTTSSPFLLLVLSLTGHHTAVAQDYVVLSQVAGTIPSTDDVEYTCTLVNLWTEARHPAQYPTANAHWSSPVAVGHSNAYTMWASGGTATEGMETLAEVSTLCVAL